MLAGKNILITGASSGIGYSMARYFHSKAAKLILAARSEDKLNNIVHEFGEGTLAYPIDLSEMENIKGIFDFLMSNGIKLDGVVHCAGTTANVPIKVNDAKQAEYIMRVNFESFAEICKYASGRRYSNDGASIVVLSSTVSLCGDKGLSIYSASKSAINTFVKCAALEFGSRNIRVNAIAPSMVETDMYYQTVRELPEVEETVKAVQPFGLIQPEYVAYLAEFLLSERSKYITGTTIVMGGGHVY